MSRYDLTRIPLIKWLLVSRWPQLMVRAIALGGFLFAILAGLVGTPVGNRNFSIVFVWIAWWALLILLAVPFLGRGWCNVCPIPMAGEWLQQGNVLGPDGKRGFGLGRKWPRRLRHIWLQNGAFTLLALFSAVVLTQPGVTAVVLAAFFFVAIGTSLIYERRAFCRYLCPVGGFIGLYSQVAPMEVRVKDTAVCATHKVKTCYTGNENGYGCPWGVFPGGMVKNTFCGTCMECLRTCPRDNIAINLRPFGTDLAQPRGRKMDEAFKAFIMLGSAFVYSAVMLGAWGGLKMTAYTVGSLAWWGYAVAFLVFIFGLFPGGFYLATQAGQSLYPTRRNPRQTFIDFAYVLVPLGLAAWIAFSLSFVFSNISYLIPVISDPMGWGWDLLGTAGFSWNPYLTQLMPALQTVVLLGGLLWASVTARRIAAENTPPQAAWRHAFPVVLFCFLVTVGLLWLLVG
jgi:ferredoxin